MGMGRANGLKGHQEGFILDIRENFFTWVKKHWHRVPRAVVETSSLKMFTAV